MGKYTTGIHPDVFEEYKERYRKFCQKEQLTAVRCAELRYQAHEFNQWQIKYLVCIPQTRKIRK